MRLDDMLNFRSFDGTRIAYRDAGEGPPVILLHGLSIDGRLFGPLDRLRPAFEIIRTSIGELGVAPTLDLPPEGRRGLAAHLLDAGARVIIPDLRGHGASDKPHDPAAYSRSAIARDVVALADRLNLGSFAAVGYSLGAITTAKLLVLEPARMTSAVLAGIGKAMIEGEELDIPPSHPAARLLKPVTMRAYSDFVADELARENPTPDDPGASYVLLARATGSDVEAVAAAIRGDGAEQIPAAALRSLSLPVLLLNGRNDPADRATGPLLHALPNAHARTCEGDHLSTPWQPSFQEAVVAFFTEQWRRPRQTRR
ncbi:MAG TPA: alpha/beta fold hydrolase [Xanthobacteraceae bacterium]|nr:alpha/beta fold hydrolase [Xanthobacteraceae bacterium]